MILRRKKSKRMIDLRELQKRGVVNIPRKDIIVPTNSDGFVELTKKKQLKAAPESNEVQTSSQSSTGSNSDFFNFLDSSSTSEVQTYNPESDNPGNFSNSMDGYNKREVDERIVNLDNKLYKLEQRLELVERKLDIQDSNNSSNVGAMGW